MLDDFTTIQLQYETRNATFQRATGDHALYHSITFLSDRIS
jgi:hypothetical protein